MTRLLAAPAAAVLLTAGLVGCGGDQPAVCSSLDDLQASVDNLKNMSLTENGLSQIQSQLGTVKDDVQKVAEDAKAQYAGQAQQLQDDVSAVTSAADTASTSPNATNLGAVGAAIRTLGSDLSSFADDLGNTC